MAADSRQRQGAIEWATRGVEAVRAGDFASGRNHLQQAIRADKRNPYYRFDLALAQQALGEIEAAIVELCAAIRLKPEFDDASRRLAMLLERYQLPNPAILDPFALRSAMAAPNADHQALAEAGLTLAMQTGSLAAAMSGLTARGPLAVAREMLAKATPNNNRYECPIRLGLKV